MRSISVSLILIPALLLITTTPTFGRELLSSPLRVAKHHRHRGKHAHTNITGGKFSTPLSSVAPDLSYALLSDFKYHGGPMMTAPANLYFIWYGNWKQPSANTFTQDVLRNFTLSLHGLNAPIIKRTATVSGWFAINSGYTGKKKGIHVSKKISLVAEYTDAYSAGRTVDNKTASQVVGNAMLSGNLPTDAVKGIYIIFTSPDVKVPGYCDQFCAWHAMDYITVKTTTYANVKYAHVPHAGSNDYCLNMCGAGWGGSPNGDPATDGMVSNYAHEITETLTDPDGSTGWTNTNLFDGENGDICRGMYGTTYNYGENATQYNMVGINGQPFLVQQNVDIRVKTCVTQAPQVKLPYLPYTPPGNCTALKGTCISLYPGADYRGTPVVFQAAAPPPSKKPTAGAPGTCLNMNGTLESIIIEWNMPRTNPTKIPGCAYVLLWDSADCVSAGASDTYIAFTDYASIDYDNTAIGNVAINLGDNVRTSTLSIECRSDLP